MIGASLAHFEVIDKIGEGGMGEVYRARDTRLGREVAIKLLPQPFLEDPERLARFEREARLLASLNHPHIAAIHGVEEDAGRRFLVLELVEGETLAETLARGRIPVKEALEIGRQVAEALEAAHTRGIVHRDLKPSNVKRTPQGSVKVLDFGLAKALEPEPGALPDLSRSPTLSYQATRAGVILGTAAYMSPEQARGKPVDRRTDIWAFGCLLYEMLAGRAPFGGETVTDVFASIVHQEPEWERLPQETPRAVRRLLRRCLEKDPERRLHDIADARLEVEDAERPAVPGIAEAEGGLEPRLRRWRVAAIACAAILLGLVGVILLLPERPGGVATVVRTIVPPPPGGRFHLFWTSPGPVAVSPDGSRLVYAVRDEQSVVRLWMRELGQLEARPLPGTEGANYPFWAPDGDEVGFFADGHLKKIDVGGGRPLTLAEAPNGKGGSWSPEGVIVFAPTAQSGLVRVPATGGVPTAITELDRERGDNSHRHPRFLPGGRRFLFVARRVEAPVLPGQELGHLLVGSLAGDEPREIMRVATNTEYAAGHLLFVRNGSLMALPFDAGKLEAVGDPLILAEGLLHSAWAALAVFSASGEGTLAYQTGHQMGEHRILEWRDRTGKVLGTVGEPELYTEVRLSPDGRLAAVGIVTGQSNDPDIWLWDLPRGVKTRFTFDGSRKCCFAWAPGGERIAWAGSVTGGRADIYLGSVLGMDTSAVLWQDELLKFPSSWTSDGRQLLYFANDGFSPWNLWRLPVEEGGAPGRMWESAFQHVFPTVSRDGRWLAYSSDESGRWEVYVTDFPESRRKWQVSVEGA
ncbi:MAG TPA: protein kinase, partial [Actinomycetota bacterium]|nr:protein kinase [Actinomycetota bacterium]